jgi:hypothetical protein
MPPLPLLPWEHLLEVCCTATTAPFTPLQRGAQATIEESRHLNGEQIIDVVQISDFTRKYWPE